MDIGQDQHIIQTALREMGEEIGIKESSVRPGLGDNLVEERHSPPSRGADPVAAIPPNFAEGFIAIAIDSY